MPIARQVPTGPFCSIFTWSLIWHLFSTNLFLQVLDDAVKPDSYERDGMRRPETILVITDGAPTDRQKVEEVIIRATFQYMERDEDLSITFMQIGDDEAATVWLTKLDDDLEAAGAQFDAVDTLTWADAKGTSFEELIRLSIYD